MDLALAAVAEQLAFDFRELQCSAVVKVLTDCADEFPNDGPLFIEQAARARLALLGRLAAVEPWIPVEPRIPEQRGLGTAPA